MAYIITPGRAATLLLSSETHGGHPCTRHLSISNEGLMGRLYAGDGGARADGYVLFISAFLTLQDAGKAASQAFAKVPKGWVKAVATGERASATLADIVVDQIFRARFAMGCGVRTFETNRVTLCIRHKPEFDPYDFIVVTFFPRPPDSLRLTPLAPSAAGVAG